MSEKGNTILKMPCEECASLSLEAKMPINSCNPAEYRLVNGQEATWLCSVCLQEVLLDLVTSNDRVAFCFHAESREIVLE